MKQSKIRSVAFALIAAITLHPVSAISAGTPPTSPTPKRKKLQLEDIKGDPYACVFALACDQGNVCYVKMVLNSGNSDIIRDALSPVELAADDLSPRSPSVLHLAQRNSHTNIVEALLVFAVHDYECLRTLLRAECDFASDEWHLTLLKYAELYPQFAERLFAFDPDRPLPLCFVAQKGLTLSALAILEFAVRHPEHAQKICAADIDNAICEAANAGKTETLVAMMEFSRHNPLIAEQLVADWLPLKCAIYRGQTETVCALLSLALRDSAYAKWILLIDNESDAAFDYLITMLTEESDVATRKNIMNMAEIFMKFIAQHPRFAVNIVNPSSSSYNVLCKAIFHGEIEFMHLVLRSPFAPLFFGGTDDLGDEELPSYFDAERPEIDKSLRALLEYAPQSAIPAVIHLLIYCNSERDDEDRIRFGQLEAAVARQDLEAVMIRLGQADILDRDLLTKMLANNRDFDRLQAFADFVKALRSLRDHRLTEIIDILENYLKVSTLPQWAARRLATFIGLTRVAPTIVDLRPGLTLFANSAYEHQLFVEAQSHTEKLIKWHAIHGNFDLPNEDVGSEEERETKRLKAEAYREALADPMANEAQARQRANEIFNEPAQGDNVYVVDDDTGVIPMDIDDQAARDDAANIDLGLPHRSGFDGWGGSRP